MLYGHLAAFFCITVWSTTYISTKVLLTVLTPLQILVIRFCIGVLLLFLVYPKRLKFQGKNELYFMGAGFFGVFLYYMFENFSLTYTMASNVSVIMSTAPFFTAIAMKICFKEEDSFNRYFLIGFVLAMIGIALISFDGTKLSMNPFGDFLAILGAVAWAFYSVFLKKVNDLGNPTIVNTRRINGWGLIFMIPAYFMFNNGTSIPWASMVRPQILWNLLFLATIASAGCFVAWNYAVEKIGVMTTSIYIYLGPIVTIAASYLLIGEPLTRAKIIGTVLTMAGLLISGKK